MLAEIQINVEKYLNISKISRQIFQKYIKKYKNISNITKYIFKKFLKPQPKPHPTRRCYFFDCLHIYYLLIIAIPNSALLQ